MMQGDAQRSRVFATKSADRPSRLLWQVEKLFRIRYSQSFSDRIGSAILVGELGTGHDFTPPLISGDTIFFATYQDDAHFYVMDAATGKQIIMLKFANNAVSYPSALGPVAFFGTSKGRVNAYDASIQKLKWSFELKDSYFGGAEPVIVDDVIYLCGYKAGVLALTADKGELLWRFKFDKGLAGPAIQGEDVILLTEKSLIALDKKTGVKKWESTIGRDFFGPSILDDQIFVRHKYGEVRAYALQDGALKWKAKKRGGAVGDLVLYKGLVIFGEEYKDLVALDARTGLEKWRFKTKKHCRDPLVAGSTLYARCRDHNHYALDAESGTLKWSIDSGGSGMTPMIVDGVMYSLSYNGVLQAFR
jgi:eukaryotic-like serine/threonine-protein kinase